MKLYINSHQTCDVGEVDDDDGDCDGDGGGDVDDDDVLQGDRDPGDFEETSKCSRAENSPRGTHWSPTSSQSITSTLSSRTMEHGPGDHNHHYHYHHQAHAGLWPAVPRLDCASLTRSTNNNGLLN